MATQNFTLYTFMVDRGDGSAGVKVFESPEARLKWIEEQEAEGYLDQRFCEDDDGTIKIKVVDGKLVLPTYD